MSVNLKGTWKALGGWWWRRSAQCSSQVWTGGMRSRKYRKLNGVLPGLPWVVLQCFQQDAVFLLCSMAGLSPAEPGMCLDCRDMLKYHMLQYLMCAFLKVREIWAESLSICQCKSIKSAEKCLTSTLKLPNLCGRQTSLGLFLASPMCQARLTAMGTRLWGRRGEWNEASKQLVKRKEDDLELTGSLSYFLSELC